MSNPRLMNNYNDRPTRENYSLKTFDIAGAQPKQWFNNRRPFFKTPDPMDHLQTQNNQYKDAIQEPLRYNQRERDPEWKLGKKYEFEDQVRAKISEIEKDGLIEKEQERGQMIRAKNVFYPRNLAVDDIEGTRPGSLNSKVVLNFEKARKIREAMDKSGMQGQRNYSQDAPYGTLNDTGTFMPDHLKRAREKASKNRSRLRIMNEFYPMKANHSPEKLPSVNDYGRKGSKIATHTQEMTEYGRRFNREANRRDEVKQELGLREAISRYDKPPKEYNIHGGLKEQPYNGKAEEERLMDDRRRYLEMERMKAERGGSMTQRPADIDRFDGRERSLKRLEKKEDVNMQNYLNGHRRRQEQLKQNYDSLGKNPIDYQQNRLSVSPQRVQDPIQHPRDKQGGPIGTIPGANQDRLDQYEMVKLRDEPYEKPQRLSTGFQHLKYQNNNPPHQFDRQRQIDALVANQQQTPGQIDKYRASNYANFPPNLKNEKQRIEQERLLQLKLERDRMNDFQKRSLMQDFRQFDQVNDKYKSMNQINKFYNGNNQDAIDQELRQRGKDPYQSKSMNDFKAKNYLENHHNAGELSNNIDEFHNGKKGEEWALQKLQTDRLGNLNNFYENYISEQNKRRKPFTKDDYTYFDTISHLPKNSNLYNKGQYYLDARTGHVIV